MRALLLTILHAFCMLFRAWCKKARKNQDVEGEDLWKDLEESLFRDSFYNDCSRR